MLHKSAGCAGSSGSRARTCSRPTIIAIQDGICSHGQVEPISAILILAGARGAGALVRAISGSSDLSELSSDLFKALAESESRIDARLSNIENLLDKLLEERYKVALSSGIRFLIDGLAATTSTSRSQDFHWARESFVEAVSAAHSSLQQAIAERYLLLSVVGLNRVDLAPTNLARVESAAIAAGLDAVLLYGREEERAVEALLHRRGERITVFRRPLEMLDYTPKNLEDAASQIRLAAGQTTELCRRLLAEAAVLAPAFGLAERESPPLSDYWSPWDIKVSIDVPIRVGCITARFSAPPAGIHPQTFTMKYIFPREKTKHEKLPVKGHLQLQIDPPLPRPFFIRTVDTATKHEKFRFHNDQVVNAGMRDVSVYLPSVKGQDFPSRTVASLLSQSGAAPLIRFDALYPLFPDWLE
jgi:hypothetical protein